MSKEKTKTTTKPKTTAVEAKPKPVASSAAIKLNLTPKTNTTKEVKSPIESNKPKTDILFDFEPSIKIKKSHSFSLLHILKANFEFLQMTTLSNRIIKHQQVKIH